MAKLSIQAGTTSQRVFVFIQDSTVTTGAGKTGLTYTSSGLKWYTARGDDGNAGGTSVTLASATLGTYTSGGFKEKDATNMPGVYELGIPNAALASGSRSATMILFGVTGMAPCLLEIELTGWDNQNATSGGLSNVDAAVSSRMATYTQPTGFLAATFPGTVASTTNITAATGITVSTNSDKTGYALTSGERTSIADALLDRDMAAGTDSGGRTVRNALRFLRNKFSISSTTLTVTKEDDSTTAWTSTLTTDATAVPITASDPS